MNIVFCSAEVVPFSQAGGLGDVAGSLPRSLSELGLQVSVITPMYGMIDPVDRHLQPLNRQIEVQYNGKSYLIQLWKGTLPGTNVPVYFLENHELYGYRQQVYPYGEPERELEGFMVFSEAVFEAALALDLKPGILHVHDWHTAAVAKKLDEKRQNGDPQWQEVRSVLTIHNLNYQGVFQGGTPDEVNWLKEGIVYADAVTTVSPTYAEEIQTQEFGAGLDGTIRAHRTKVSGILNGIDTQLYNPETNAFLTHHYTVKDYEVGKAACKELIQVELGLPKQPETPLVGFVGRLTDQKGLDILLPVMRELKDQSTQFAILGTGDPVMEAALKELNAETINIRSHIGFNTAMAHKIYAACDLFVMPSQFEPCGLGQMIAMRFGTVPVVRAVGGLADTVFDIRANPDQGNGFVFHDYTPFDLAQTLDVAVQCYYDKPFWNKLVERCMTEEHSWGGSARAYESLYGRLVRQTVHVGG